MTPRFLQPFKKFADFKGRASRTEYWAFHSFMAATYFASIVAVVAVNWGDDPLSMMVPVLMASFAVLLVFSVPAVSVGVRRLHDAGFSGLWTFIVLLPYLGLLVLMVLCCLPGDNGDNRYGPDPLAED